MIPAKTFEFQYHYKGKIVAVRTEKNFNTMINRNANQDGVYEIECVLIEDDAGETLDPLEATARPSIKARTEAEIVREAKILKEFGMQQEKLKQKEEAEKQEKIQK